MQFYIKTPINISFTEVQFQETAILLHNSAKGSIAVSKLTWA